MAGDDVAESSSLHWQAITQLQMKKLQTNQQLALQARQTEQLKKEIRYRQLVLEELSGLSDGTRVYSACGRAFLLQPVPEIEAEVQAKVSGCQDKIRSVEGNKAYLEQSLKEAENNLREMIQAKRSK